MDRVRLGDWQSELERVEIPGRIVVSFESERAPRRIEDLVEEWAIESIDPRLEVESARQLTQLTGLDDLVEFVVGDATALDLDGPFDAATLVHVGMNIQDKAAFFSAVAQLVKPGGRLGVFDIMAVGDPSTVGYPMPFAASADQAFLSSPDAYVEALRAAGFDVAEPVDRTSLALESAAEAAAQGPPPVSLATLMGPEFASMFANAGAALRNNVLAPVEIIATR